MGLDMYLHVEIQKEFGPDREGFNTTITRNKMITSWRKHYDLHNYMRSIHHVVLTEDEYNCVRTYLDKDQLLQLMNRFPESQDDFRLAADYLERGFNVYYHSWW